MFTRALKFTTILEVFWVTVAVLCVGVTIVLADEIVSFGDSITKGYPYLDGREGQGRVNVGGYQPELADLLKNSGRESRIYNWGISGENTIHGYLRFDDVLALHPQADYVLILEGTNDWPLGLSVSETISNLQIMINRGRSVGIEPILATMTPATDKGAEKEQAIKNQYNPKIRALAERRGVLLADMYTAMADNWEALSDDGLHPNRSGYRIMADVWFKALSTPVVQTMKVAVDGTNARLDGIIRPNSNTMLRYFFQYGQTVNYGLRSESFLLETEAKEASVSVDISDLLPETTYIVRLVVQNTENETIVGNNVTFNTGMPSPDGGGGCFISTVATP